MPNNDEKNANITWYPSKYLSQRLITGPSVGLPPGVHVAKSLFVNFSIEEISAVINLYVIPLDWHLHLSDVSAHDKYECDIDQMYNILMIQKNWINNRIDVIGLVTWGMIQYKDAILPV